jgi:hypothetical protein
MATTPSTRNIRPTEGVPPSKVPASCVRASTLPLGQGPSQKPSGKHPALVQSEGINKK